METTYKALVIPARGPLQDVALEVGDEGGSLSQLQGLVGGMIEAVPLPDFIPGAGSATGYVNEDGKYTEGCAPNPRATAFLVPGVGLFRRDFVAGALVLCGFDLETGEHRDLPESVAQRAWVIDAEWVPQLREPDEVETDLDDRKVKYRWVIVTDGESRTVAELYCGHSRPGANSAAHGSEFFATLSHRTEEPMVIDGRKYGTSVRLTLGDGVRVFREDTPRYSARGLEAFAPRALAALGLLYETGEPTVTRHFSPEQVRDRDGLDGTEG